MFETHFYKVHDSASGISGFYAPSLSKDEAKPDVMLHDQRSKMQAEDETNTDTLEDFVVFDFGEPVDEPIEVERHIDAENSQSRQDVQSSLSQADKMPEHSTQDFKTSTDTSSYAKNARLLVKQESNKKLESMFETHFYKVHDSASGISGFYAPSLSKDEAKPEVFSAIIDAIKAANESKSSRSNSWDSRNARNL